MVGPRVADMEGLPATPSPLRQAFEAKKWREWQGDFPVSNPILPHRNGRLPNTTFNQEIKTTGKMKI